MTSIRNLGATTKFDGTYYGKCSYCQIVYPASELTRDHVWPKSKGGPNAKWNLALACRACNEKKADKPPQFLPPGKRFKKLKEWLQIRGVAQ